MGKRHILIHVQPRCSLFLRKHAQYTELFSAVAQKIDRGYTLERVPMHNHVRTSTHAQSMFWSKNNKKNRYTTAYQICYIKVGYKGVFISRTFYRDACQVGRVVVCKKKI